MNCYQFPRQKVFCDNSPFSRELLQSLLEIVYATSPPFTGYLKIAGDECSLLFLFFFNGAPYAAGRYADSKPVCYSIHELGGYLARSSKDSMTLSLCETDPVLLKNMLLFMQEEPDVKAPTILLDFEHIVRQIDGVGENAMIALCRDKKINFFFFRKGKATLAHFGDQTFKRLEGMTVDEEMQLYAFQPGEKVQAFIFRDMITSMAEDSSQLDKDSLYNLLSVGYPKNRRRGDAEISPETTTNDVGALRQEPKLQNVLLTVESGPLKGEHFTVTLPCTIGRKGCDLMLDDRLISRRHAELKMVGDELVIEDLGSTNGTKVNSKSVTTKRLVPNDLISIGPTNLRIYPA